ncbi:MAG: sugar transferase [Anaerolineae bacterium]
MDLIVINQRRAFPHRRRYRITKRIMDVAVCLLAMPFVLPLIGICALAILFDSPGPALFVQERIGRGGCRFRIFKFRTMEHNLDDSAHRAFMKAFVEGEVGDEGSSKECELHGVFKRVSRMERQEGSSDGAKVYKPPQSRQVTRVGRLLRKTSLDELPQFFNVLKGDMSLVGPRPNVLWEVESYRDWHNERLEILPGITGLAQVRGRSSIGFDSIVEHDIEYIENMSLSLDLKILWWTISSVFKRQGAG